MTRRGRPSKKRYCKYCGVELPVATERRQNYCSDCGMKRTLQNWRDLKAKKGYFYEKWRHSLMRALEEPKPK